MTNLTVSYGEIVKMDSRFVEMFMLGKLRDAGIPVRGFFFFRGIASGRLYEWQDFDGVHFQWKADD